MSLPDTVAATLADVCAFLRDHGIWHCLTYGTLLGAVREQDVIAWDDDFDLFIRPRDIRRLLSLEAAASHGFRFELVRLRPTQLAVNPCAVDGGAGQIAVWRDGAKCGDLFAFTLFNDGVLRRFDLETGVYWVPHSSFPHYFVDMLDTATIRGRTYPAPRRADVFLAGVYGADWRTPYRAERLGGTGRAGVTIHGDRYEPKLRTEIAWCEAQGWDRTRYRHEPRWPRPIAAAGPIGPDSRTADSSRALWWRSLAELIEHY
jgi:hypothetical protein